MNLVKCTRLSIGAAFAAIVSLAFVQNARGQAERGEISYICIEAETGLVLAERNADAVRPPASMIKMVQFLMVAEGLHEGKWTLDTEITVSAKAQRMGGTQVYLEAGEVWPLGHLMEAVAVASANDAAMAVAEGLWGSEAAYREAVNKRVREIGMSRSTFRSVHGLPPDRGEKPDETTARDMVLLGRWCMRDPQIVKWASQETLKFRPEQALFRNTNKLLGKVDGLDGIKTGYIYKSGYCVTVSAARNGIRLVATVMGHTDGSQRFKLAENLLDDGFDSVMRRPLVAKGEKKWSAVPVAAGTAIEAEVAAASGIEVVVRTDAYDRLVVNSSFVENAVAPIREGEVLGRVWVELDGVTLKETELISTATIESAPWSRNALAGVFSIFGRD